MCILFHLPKYAFKRHFNYNLCPVSTVARLNIVLATWRARQARASSLEDSEECPPPHPPLGRVSTIRYIWKKHLLPSESSLQQFLTNLNHRKTSHTIVTLLQLYFWIFWTKCWPNFWGAGNSLPCKKYLCWKKDVNKLLIAFDTRLRYNIFSVMFFRPPEFLSFTEEFLSATINIFQNY